MTKSTVTYNFKRGLGKRMIATSCCFRCKVEGVTFYKVENERGVMVYVCEECREYYKMKKKDKSIRLIEVDPDKEYVCLVDPHLFKGRPEELRLPNGMEKDIPIFCVEDVDKTIKFVKVPKLKKEEE